MKATLIVGACLTVVTAGLVLYLSDREPSVDCGSYELDRARWANERRAVTFASETQAERFVRQAARNLVRCGNLMGLTGRQVRRLLGKPDYRGRDANPRLHMEFGYVVGFVPERGSDEEDSLFMEFDKGRVAYVAAPERQRGGYDKIMNGIPVGGGPRGAR